MCRHKDKPGVWQSAEQFTLIGLGERGSHYGLLLFSILADLLSLAWLTTVTVFLWVPFGVNVSGLNNTSAQSFHIQSAGLCCLTALGFTSCRTTPLGVRILDILQHPVECYCFCIEQKPGDTLRKVYHSISARYVFFKFFQILSMVKLPLFSHGVFMWVLIELRLRMQYEDTEHSYKHCNAQLFKRGSVNQYRIPLLISQLPRAMGQ